MKPTFRRVIGLLVAGTATLVGLAAGPANAATESTSESTSPLIPVQCSAINLGANVSNFAIGYAFSGRCDPAHPIVIQAQWYDSLGNVLGDISGQFPRRTAGTWSTYSGILERPHDIKQTTHACIWVTQDVLVWYGGPLLTSGCFPRNS